jgi:phage tail-like protein
MHSPRPDPYMNFKFRVKHFDTRVAGVSEISGLDAVLVSGYTFDLSTGPLEYTPLVLRHGVTHDGSFQLWARTGHTSGRHLARASRPRDLTIDEYNDAGERVSILQVYRCWVSQYRALQELKSGEPCAGIQLMQLEHEGWNLDRLE